MKKILITFCTVILTVGFIFSTPDSTVSRVLMQNQIDAIKEANIGLLNSSSNSNIAFAQEEGENIDTPSVPICCSLGESPNPDEYCDNATQCIAMCCGTSGNPNAGYRCDSTLCGGGGDCQVDNSCTKTKICTDVNAQNYTDPSTPNTESGLTCLYLQACCIADDPMVKNYAGAETCSNPRYESNPGYCTYKTPICCDGNWDSFIPPSERDMTQHYCEYDGGTCMCNVNPPHSGSQCGGGNNYCVLQANFSVVKSGIALAGSAILNTYAECGSESEQQQLKNYVAGLAAADVTPSTPLLTPVILDAFSVYTVTSRDYCLNILGVQSSGEGYSRSSTGVCCASPDVLDTASDTCISGASCGLSNGQFLSEEPTSLVESTSLCTNGDASAVTTATTTYSWTCSVSSGGNTLSTVSCSANHACQGPSCAVCTDLDCGTSDLCKNISGSQDNAYLASNNLTPDSFGFCWNTTSGACGSISQIPYVTSVPSSNLCISSSSPSAVSYSNETKKYSWNCISNANNNNINPLCQVRHCTDTECQTNQATSTLIISFKAQPSIVSKDSEGCTLTWNSTIDSSIPDPEQMCQLNGNPVTDDNITGTKYGPGSYSLMCRLGDAVQIKNVKCSINPDFKEI